MKIVAIFAFSLLRPLQPQVLYERANARVDESLLLTTGNRETALSLATALLFPAAEVVGQTPGPRTAQPATQPEVDPEDAALGDLFPRIADGKGAGTWESRMEFLRKTGISEPKAALVIRVANRYMGEFSAAQNRMDLLKRANAGWAERKPVYEKDAAALKALWDQGKRELAEGLGKEDYQKLRAFLASPSSLGLR
jgi:hypothetical protein